MKMISKAMVGTDMLHLKLAVRLHCPETDRPLEHKPLGKVDLCSQTNIFVCVSGVSLSVRAYLCVYKRVSVQALVGLLKGVGVSHVLHMLVLTKKSTRLSPQRRRYKSSSKMTTRPFPLIRSGSTALFLKTKSD